MANGKIGVPRRLTSREMQVIRCVCTGLSTKEIAERMQIKPATVTFHRATIYRKLRIGTLTALRQFAAASGIEPDCAPHKG